MMRLQAALKHWSWVAWMLLTASWVAWGLAYLVRPGPPIEYGPVTVDTPTVIAGGVAHFTYAIQRNRACPAKINGFWLNPHGEAIKRMEAVLGGYGKLGNVRTPVSIQTPVNYTGSTCYRAYTYHSCEDANYVTVSPDACVTLTDK